MLAYVVLEENMKNITVYTVRNDFGCTVYHFHEKTVAITILKENCIGCSALNVVLKSLRSRDLATGIQEISVMSVTNRSPSEYTKKLSKIGGNVLNA
jgi:Fe-S cluster biogenesis protein NfuA